MVGRNDKWWGRIFESWEMITNLVGVYSANEGQGGEQALFIYEGS